MKDITIHANLLFFIFIYQGLDESPVLVPVEIHPLSRPFYTSLSNRLVLANFLSEPVIWNPTQLSQSTSLSFLQYDLTY